VAVFSPPDGKRTRSYCGDTAPDRLADRLVGVGRDEILRLAGVVVADRGQRYGEPEQNFERIAVLWRAWMKIRWKGELRGLDVAVMLALMKVGRIANDPEHIDNFVDWAGYGACAGELATTDDGEQGEE
jgi:hypothetical protein